MRIGTLILTCSFFLMLGVSYAQDLGTDEQRAAGRKVYDANCSQCHGDNGDGAGVAKDYFAPTPRDFLQGLFKIRTTASGELPTDEDIRQIIKLGMPYTGMPAWPNLSDDELSNVVYYIKTFVSDFADPEFVAAPIEIPKPLAFSDASAERGRVLYEENKCNDCHGNLGRGDGKSAPTLEDEWHEPIRPADLTKRWTFRGGPTRQDIYRTFVTGVNGTPMPTYAELIEGEDRWHLVNYVHSLSRDEPEYSTVVVATGIEDEIDITQGASLFQDAAPGFFPVFGQVVEPGRQFFPGVNAVEVRAVFNADDIAIMVTWNDMTAERSGFNGPALPAPRFEDTGAESATDKFSDAVAVQIPSKNVGGFEKPYFLFGDSKKSVDLWFADLATDRAELHVGKGSQSIEATGEDIPVVTSYEDGQWNVVFKRSRQSAAGQSFDEGAFTPIALSVWDGFSGECGNKRGVTQWYNVYLEPLERESNVGRIAGLGLLTLLAEVVLIGAIRLKNRP